MKTRLPSILIHWSLPGFLAVSALAADRAPSLEPLQGKWLAKKTSREGDPYSQVIEIKKDQLTFQIFDADKRVRMAGQGIIKTEKFGPFHALFLSNVRAGGSLAEMEPVDASRAVIYAVRDGALFIAVNFDEERENEPPTTDRYERDTGVQDAAAAAFGAEAKLQGAWKLELMMDDNTLDYELRISRTDGRLAGILVSPRSGEHQCKSVELKDGELVIEVERDLQGNEVTFVYRGRLSAEGLAGKCTIKGAEDRFNYPWKASK